MRQNLSRATGFFVVVCLSAACQRDNSPAAGDGDHAPDAEAAPTVESAAPPVLPRSSSPEGARVWFVTPANGDTVTSPVNIEFGSTVTIVKAGTEEDASGHHHLIVDADLPDPSQPIPADENYIHFGDASTSTELELAPGEHRLTLLLGDYLHIPHDPPVYSDSILITVTE